MKSISLLGAVVLMAMLAVASAAEESAYLQSMQFKVHEGGPRITYRGKWVDLEYNDFRLIRALAQAPDNMLTVEDARAQMALPQHSPQIYNAVDRVNEKSFNATGAPLLELAAGEVRLRLYPQPAFVQRNRQFLFDGKLIEFTPVHAHIIDALGLNRLFRNAEVRLSSAEFAALGLTPNQVQAALTEINRKYLELFKDPLVAIVYADFNQRFAYYWDGESLQRVQGGAEGARAACDRRLRQQRQAQSSSTL